MLRKNTVLSGQSRKMVYDVHCYIKQETAELVENLKQVKKQTNDIINKLFRHLNMSVTSLSWIEKRIGASSGSSNLPVLTQTCQDMLQIKEETADAIKTEINKLDDIIKKISQNQKRTAAATNTSVATVRRITTQADNSELLVPVFKTPGKRRPRAKPVTDIDNFDQGIIKRCIHNFHLTHKELPTLQKLKHKLQEDINFQGSVRSLRRVIKNLGFRWKKTENNRRMLIESSNIRLQRIEYLEKLKKFRQEGKTIIYSDESYIDSSSLIVKDCTDSAIKGLKQPTCKGQRVIFFHAGSVAGFVPNALHIFKAGFKAGDYNDYMNYDNYEKWLRMQLMPNLPPNCVVVVDNASYHNKLWNVIPTSNAKKAEMLVWLTEKGIDCDETLLKPQLYKLIAANKDKFKIFSIDKILAEQNHIVLRLPPYHKDLNPIEMAWSIINQYVSSKIVNWNINNVTELIQEKVNLMGKQDWEILCQKIQAIEDEYARSDEIVDMMTEEYNIRVDGLSSESDSSDGDSSGNDDENDDQISSSDDDVKPCISYLSYSTT